MVPFESLGAVSYLHSKLATMAVSLAVSTQYTNVTDTACTKAYATLMVMRDKCGSIILLHIRQHYGYP